MLLLKALTVLCCRLHWQACHFWGVEQDDPEQLWEAFLHPHRTPAGTGAQPRAHCAPRHVQGLLLFHAVLVQLPAATQLLCGHCGGECLARRRGEIPRRIRHRALTAALMIDWMLTTEWLCYFPVHPHPNTNQPHLLPRDVLYSSHISMGKRRLGWRSLLSLSPLSSLEVPGVY